MAGYDDVSTRNWVVVTGESVSKTNNFIQWFVSVKPDNVTKDSISVVKDDVRHEW